MRRGTGFITVRRRAVRRAVSGAVANLQPPTGTPTGPQRGPGDFVDRRGGRAGGVRDRANPQLNCADPQPSCADPRANGANRKANGAHRKAGFEVSQPRQHHPPGQQANRTDTLLMAECRFPTILNRFPSLDLCKNQKSVSFGRVAVTTRWRRYVRRPGVRMTDAGNHLIRYIR